ncbi:hypothetical protein EMIHUDRAFT_241517 [Emiliania huxleyi CCMP1516]|uniref:Uncharacterized protein n=2 Tax=Emiliania huxleyi TaxID=2903 RepID=A0A0D3JCF6_EMIH1|nr:hypothetical protein EMIHUDRAFT_241517 [Emiliania huxleyi CCMP1516]EOD21191.1 hypothetical protein EMIHUDRAFT_241517 [Emiliania huxleyi CCMP1516]|eukprot:XP_005773620.1 hypothetical protein EMIHUDRAFT_241517 [Emiliania huxleyi CCMP1516]
MSAITGAILSYSSSATALNLEPIAFKEAALARLRNVAARLFLVPSAVAAQYKLDETVQTGYAILANPPVELALGAAGLLFLALCFSRCCCRRREPPHKRLVEPDEEEAGGGKPSPRRPKRRSDAMPFLHANRSAAELKLAEQVAELERHLAVSKATRPEVASLVQMARAASEYGFTVYGRQVLPSTEEKDMTSGLM